MWEEVYVLKDGYAGLFLDLVKVTWPFSFDPDLMSDQNQLPLTLIVEFCFSITVLSIFCRSSGGVRHALSIPNLLSWSDLLTTHLV